MTAARMKRFYKTVSVDRQGSGFALLLDGRGVKTPARQPLVLPSAALARAVAAEWQAQGDEINIASMAMTGFANAAIDRIAPEPALFVREIASFGETDTLCYRADSGDPLAVRQGELWDPMLEWAENFYDITLIRIAGVIHQPQPPHSLLRLKAAVAPLNPFVLAPMITLTTIGGSLVAALGLLEGAFDLATVWRAISLEELWQEELWGVEAEAVKARLHRKLAFDEAYKFCCIAKGMDLER